MCDLRLTTLETVPVVTADAATDTEEESSGPVITASPEGPEGYKRTQDRDAIFFRLGFFNYMKLNDESMIHETANDVWYKVDMLINWDEQLVSIYVDGEAKNPAQPFFVTRKRKV